jgi:spermidine synthase
MTLPLITLLVIRSERGERGIGAVYAVNTLGAIAGVLLAVHLLMPSLGLKGLMLTGTSIDMALAIALLYAARAQARQWTRTSVTLAGVLLIGVTTVSFELDPRKLAAGVYRSADVQLPPFWEVLSHEDGKTATISVVRRHDPDVTVLRTNGKADASVSTDPQAISDEQTQILLSAIPLAYRPTATHAAIVGFGSGYTTKAVLASPKIERVDTIEIEPKVIVAGRWFKFKTAEAFDDPRSHIHIDGAKSYFAATGGRYDIIISEPSNPWVSGISSLFTEEFYTIAARHLKDGGVFTQ